jgi:hypothetical protein
MLGGRLRPGAELARGRGQVHDRSGRDGQHGGRAETSRGDSLTATAAQPAAPGHDRVDVQPVGDGGRRAQRPAERLRV